jgi:hypothetical protein
MCLVVWLDASPDGSSSDLTDRGDERGYDLCWSLVMAAPGWLYRSGVPKGVCTGYNTHIALPCEAWLRVA